MQLPRRTAARFLVAILLLSTFSPASVSAETAFSLQAVRYNLTYVAGQLALFFSDLADAIASHIPGTSLTASAAAPIPSPIAPPAPAPDFLATTTLGVSTPPTTPSASDAPPTTIIQQPVIERIVERTVPAPAASGISEQTLASRLASLKDDLLLRIAAVASAPIAFSGPAPTTPISTATFATSQRIDQLTNTAINTPTITGGTISSATVSGTLSGTFSGTVSSLTMSSIPWGLIATDGAGNFLATSTPTVASIVATSTTATSTFAGGLTAANGGFNILQNGNAGIGTTTPNVQLHLNKSTGGELQFTRTTGGSTVHTLGFIQFGNTDVDTSLASIVASQDGATDAGRLFFQTQATDGSLATAMTILSNGNVGIGTTTPWGKLSIKGSGTGTGLAFAVTDSANTPRFVIQDNGNVGIGTTSPTSKLYIDSGAGGFGGNPTAVIQGGGDAPTSVQLLLRNTREGGGTGNDYENEVHLRLQAGSTQDHRAYINFADYTGTDQWLTGRNASNTWILFSNTSGHRMRMFDDGVSGRTELASTGAYPVMINPSETGTSHGTGGFEVYGGGPSPAPLMFDVAPYTNDQVAVSSFNNGSGYAPASLRLEAQQAASRGQGIFHYNTVSDTSWFTGVPYNTAGAKWMVGYESNATWDPAVAQTSNALFTIQNNGSVGIGTTSPTNKLEVAGNAFFGGTITGTSTLALTGTTGTSTIATGQGFTIGSSQFVLQQGSGNVGIGTTNPGASLHIGPGTATTGGLTPSLAVTGQTTSGDAETMIALQQGGNTLGSAVGLVAGVVSGGSPYFSIKTRNSGGTSVERMRIDSSGYVGIGTTTPWGKLSIKGSGTGTGLAFAVADSANAPRFVIQDNGNVGIGTTNPGRKLEVSGGDLGVVDGDMVITSTTDTDQFLNINTTASNSYSYIKGAAKNSSGTARGWRVGYSPVSDTVNLVAAAGIDSALGLAITTTGNVGIGTTSPTAKLHVANAFSGTTANANAANLVLENSSTVGMSILSPDASWQSLIFGSPSANNAAILDHNYNANLFRIQTITATPITFSTNAAERVRIDSSGNVGIGTTTPAYRLDVMRDVAGQSLTQRLYNPNTASGATVGQVFGVFNGNVGLMIEQSSNATGPSWASGQYDAFIRTQQANSNLHFGAGSANTPQLTVNSSGNVGIGTTTPTAQLHTTGTVRFSNFGAGTLTTDASGNLSVSSDERLKNIDGAFTRGLADIVKLTPISYHWNDISGLDKSTQYAGFSAQNVQQAVPEAVGSSTNGYLTLQDRPLIAALVNATKEIGTIAGAFRSSLIGWLGSASNGIGDLFAKDIYATNGTFDTTSTRKLCITDGANDNAPLCVTKSQLAALLGQTGAASLPISVIPHVPVIELNGNASSTIDIGDTYNDLGARIVAPTSDLNLGLTIVLDGATTTAVSIDTNMSGEHTILYTVTSPATGLTGTIMRTVIVSPAEQSPEPPANDNPFNAVPANDNASSTPAASNM